jgi:hypothetical protein
MTSPTSGTYTPAPARGSCPTGKVQLGDYDDLAVERILRRIQLVDTGHSTPCWISDRAANAKGYTKSRYPHDRASWYTHRLAYVLLVGPIPKGLQLDHLCRQPACCNPDHLEPVTARENLVRGETVTAREVATTHCPRGHEYTNENTYRRPDNPNKRDCKECRRQRNREWGRSGKRPSRAKPRGNA